MISNSTNIEIIHELIEQLGQQGLHGLNELLSRLFNEMMKAERDTLCKPRHMSAQTLEKVMLTVLKIKRYKLVLDSCNCKYLKLVELLFIPSAWKRAKNPRGL